MIAVLSVGNSAVFGCSRTLAALAAQGLAPKFLAYIDRKGRPLGGIALSAIVGLLCFTVVSKHETEVFSWLMALTGLSSIFTWGSICLCHIRFRRAMKLQGRTLDEIPFKSSCGVIGSWYGFTINVLVLIAQFYTALFPIGGEPNPSDFFQAYLAAPVCLVFYIAYKAIKRPAFVHCRDADLDSGRREIDMDLLRQEVHEEETALASRGFFYRVYKFWC
ncbi:amino acid permease GAP1 [Sugiyamaella lignohabitans]|uniref:Amino acid permease GAP1 n=1 Tax=Sugiyamaella lignohabitans TaxID=796027 RepID=A0A170QZ50_9ASCO|nr:amino acid permease GAP1 [Sugiyamaella lignohabitans]ANB16002.1 amino acid permease GAP1 [Sugiyamaella lignohabitans]